MASSKQIHRIATNPTDYIRFVTTGRLPEGKRPSGPLVDLLKAIAPRDLAAIRGVRVGPALGYSGSRTFATALQALHWACPDEEVFGSFPANSWQDRRFQRALTIEDLIEASAAVPQGLAERYPRLRRSQRKGG